MRLVKRIRDFYAGRLQVGDRLAEMFYAVWMAVVSIGLLNSETTITADVVFQVVAIAIGVNAGWGIIDGVTVMYTNVMARAERERVVHDLRTGGGAGARGRARENLDGSIAAVLDDAEKERIVAVIAGGAAGPDPASRRYRPGRDDWLYALGIFGIDVVLALPVVAPLLVVGDTNVAIYVSRLLATLMFAALGWAYARNLNRNPWLAAAFLGLIGSIVFTVAFKVGW